MYFNFIPLSITLLQLKLKLFIFFQEHVSKIHQINRACKWLTFFLSDLDYNTPRCRKNIVCVESEVIGSDDSTIKIMLNLSSSQKI